MPAKPRFEHEYFPAAADECDGCEHQKEKRGGLWCEYYNVTVLFFYPQCMRLRWIDNENEKERTSAHR